MAITPIKVLLFLAGVTAAAGATAYVAGVFDPYLGRTPPAVATEPAKPPQVAALPPAEPAPAAEPPAAEQPAAAVPPPATVEPPGAVAPPASAPAAEAPPPLAPAVQPPTFDLVRAEGDGSLVIAGHAAPNAKVEIVLGSRIIGSAIAGTEGDFAIVIDEPLKPGDYQLVLRSTTQDNVVAMSQETAVVSIPETPDGQVLALVEEPGQPAKLITVPQPEVPSPKPAEAATDPAPPPASQPAAPAPADQDVAAADPKPAPAEPVPPTAEVVAPKIAVEAVEIEGRKIFVAGSANPGVLVRAYANEILLGETKASEGGRFLIEAERDLAVGDYIIRVDVLAADGVKVIARAAVPFEREPGENLAAVAPPSAAPRPAPAPAVDPAPPALAEAPAQAPVAPAPSPAPPEAVPPAVAEAPAPEPATEPAPPPAVAEAPAVSQPASPPAAAEAPAPPPAVVDGPAPVVEPPAEVAAAAPPAEPEPAPPEALSPKLQAVDGAVIIRRGDNLWRISKRVYGRGVRYSTIYLANQEQIRDPDRIWPGQVFSVPDKSKEGEPADMKKLGEQAVKITPYNG